jgi:hypothetical protein
MRSHQLCQKGVRPQAHRWRLGDAGARPDSCDGGGGGQFDGQRVHQGQRRCTQRACVRGNAVAHKRRRGSQRGSQRGTHCRRRIRGRNRATTIMLIVVVVVVAVIRK